MIDLFRDELREQFGVTKRHKLLVALSGGLDSVVLTHLLYKEGMKFALAHCNFQLRGAESDGDERFCKRLAGKLKVTLYTKRFDVEEYRRQTGQSVQMAARELRYRWFARLIGEEHFDFLLTAHHANDLAETMLLNLVRGTGINGLKGIPPVSGKVIRPLLRFSRSELKAYVDAEKLRYREDSSNASEHYDRNFVRLEVMPALAELNPAIVRTFRKNAARFAEEAEIVNEYLAGKADLIISRSGDEIRIRKSGIKNEKRAASLLHYVLAPFGFNETHEKNIARSLSTSLPGKIFSSRTHQLTIDRFDVVIRPVPADDDSAILYLSWEELAAAPFLDVSPMRKFSAPRNGSLVVSRSKLEFPVVWRPPRNGDKFQPFGMKGKKLLSDFFREQKLNAFGKKRARVLENGNGDIVWVAPLRSDERYRVKGTERDLYQFKVV
jgi:tRNA(Ile)-lysidine synthase